MKHLLTYIALLFLAGCASVSVTAGDTGGMTYYRPLPYLLVTNTQTSVVYLPDLSHAYTVNVKPGFGKASASITLHDGWQLQSVNATADSEVPETLTALGSVVAPLLKLSAGQAALAPGLYRIDFDPQAGSHVSLTRLSVH